MSSNIMNAKILLTGIWLRHELGYNLIDCVLDSFTLLAEFDELLTARLIERQCVVIFLDFDLSAHRRTEAFAEFGVVYVAVAVDVENISHDCLDFFLSRVNLHGFEVPFEVLIADEAVPIDVKFLEKRVGARFGHKCTSLNFTEQFPDALGIVIVSINFDRLSEAEVFIDKLRRWVGTRNTGQLERQGVCILFEDKWSDLVDVSRAVLVVDKGRQEPFDVTFCYLAVNHLFAQGDSQKFFELVDSDVVVLVLICEGFQLRCQVIS